MSLIRRCVTFVTCLLLFQLTALGGQAACDAHDRDDATRHEQHDPTHAPAPAPSDDCDDAGMGASCASMPVCSVTLDAPERVVTNVTVPSPLALLPEPVSSHSHPVAGPDVPPPRG
jgi:hypothetical protein